MKLKHITFLLSLLLLSSCCKEDDNKDTIPKNDLTQLPPETQEGKDTFGCLVNGQVWRNQGAKPFGAPDLQGSYFKGGFSISGRKILEPLRESIAININEGFKGVGLYQLNTNVFANGRRTAFFLYSDANSRCEYYSDSVNTGTLEITRFDPIPPYIVSGRFSFTLSTLGCDTVRITEGRFDHKYAN